MSLTGKSDDLTPELLTEAKRLIRLKYYSYSTEKTYLQWIKQFLDYAKQTGRKENVAELGTDDCKNFLSYLTLQKKVSASTQDQAFNAILFLFRYVLCKDMGNMAENTPTPVRNGHGSMFFRRTNSPLIRVPGKCAPSYQRYGHSEYHQEGNQKGRHS